MKLPVKISAPAKVNLALDILQRRPDGYHEMDMVNARSDLADRIIIEAADADETVFDGLDVPAVNTLTKTLDMLRKHGLKNRYRIVVEKNIPEKAGLGGGSADAAALLLALCRIENLPLSTEQLEQIGFQIGADVPCCLHEGFTRVRSMGEQVEDLPVSWRIPAVLVKGEDGISTPEAFARYDCAPTDPLDIEAVEQAVLRKDFPLLEQTMANAFEPSAFRDRPALASIKEEMHKAGLSRVIMSGSGSCLAGFCADEETMNQAFEKLKEKYPFIWKGWIGSC